MAEKIYNVLFLCTGNSARSIMAEALTNHLGKGRFRGFSAGSHAKGRVDPMTLQLLTEVGLPTAGLRSKSWDDFASPDSPTMDFVFTVCDQAAGEACPAWPGNPVTAHWGVADPAAIEGDPEKRRSAFRRAFRELENRIRLFASLRLEQLDRMSLKNRLDAIGKSGRD
jgi:arsenate reductase (thioredoxin)